MNVRRGVLALASLLLLTLAVPAFASPRIVRLSYVAGDVRIDRNKTAGVEQAILNMPVVEGTRIYSVGDDARVEIEFENGSTLRLVGNGEIAFRQLGSIDNGNKQSLVEMAKGTAYFDVKNHDGDDFRVMLHDRDVTVRKSSHFRIQLEEPDTTVAVFNGELELEGQADRVLIKKNETLSLETADHSRYFLSRQITTVEGDSFDQERSQYIASHSNSDAYQYAGVSYGAPYSYGVGDMAYYGNYAYYPGYGYLWRPAGFGIGWDPFGFGAWSFYPGAGWVFVSSYAWGWTPYRYGQWVNVPGHGWCWGPYGRIGGRGWYPVPVVRGGYPGFAGHGHGPIPVPWVHRPQVAGGRTISVGGGGFNARREPRDGVVRLNPAQGPNGRPGHLDQPGHGGRPGGSNVVGPAGNAVTSPANGGITVQGGALSPSGNGGGFRHGGPVPTPNGAVTTPGGAITTPGGAITTPGGAITTPGGAITTQGGAVTPVVPGLARDGNRDADLGDRNRQNGHRVVQNWQPPAVSNAVSGTPAATMPASSPAATPHEPMRRFDPPAVTNNPSPRMSAPPVTAPVQHATPAGTPAISMPSQHQSAPPVTAPASAPAARPSAPAVAPAGRPAERSPQAFRGGGGSAPQMRSVGASSFRSGGSSGMPSGGSMSHGSSGSSHSSGGSSSSSGHGRGH